MHFNTAHLSFCSYYTYNNLWPPFLTQLASLEQLHWLIYNSECCPYLKSIGLCTIPALHGTLLRVHLAAKLCTIFSSKDGPSILSTAYIYFGTITKMAQTVFYSSMEMHFEFQSWIQYEKHIYKHNTHKHIYTHTENSNPHIHTKTLH